MRNTALVLASMTLAVLLACVAVALAAVPSAARTSTVTLVGAGDIARCNARHDEHTAKLINNVLRNLTPDGTLPALNRARVITLGDNAYINGTRAQFANCYDNYRLTDGMR
jgi:ABC-type phosphate transport system substrate-binding protein